MQRREFSLGLLGTWATWVALGGWTAQAHAGAEDWATAQAAWRAALARIEAATGGRLGAAVLDTGSGRSLGWREHERFAMAFKLLLAGWMLARVEQGAERLEARVDYGPEVLLPHSPVTGLYAGPRRETAEGPRGGGMSVAQLCHATVTQSDNAAANLLLARHGGPQALTAWLRALGDDTTRLDRTEPALNEAAIGDPRDTSTPQAMSRSMRRMLVGEALSATSRQQLCDWAVACATGDKRLRAGLPGWKGGDKTGTAPESGTANDVGIFWPPGGGAPLLVVGFLTRAQVGPEARDAAIADVARAAARAWPQPLTAS
jgi:beta-lactamase class A